MSLALSTGVTGLKAYQQMLDVASNNLANIGTTGFKTSRMTFAQLPCLSGKKTEDRDHTRNNCSGFLSFYPNSPMTAVITPEMSNLP